MTKKQHFQQLLFSIRNEWYVQTWIAALAMLAMAILGLLWTWAAWTAAIIGALHAAIRTLVDRAVNAQIIELMRIVSDLDAPSQLLSPQTIKNTEVLQTSESGGEPVPETPAEKSDIEIPLPFSFPPPNKKEDDETDGYLPPEGDIYFDIETYNQKGANFITTICWLKDEEFHSWTNRRDGTGIPTEFLEALKSAARVITFNGENFDIPHIEKAFGISVANEHIDLMQIAHSKKMKGSLKDLEKKYGVERPEQIKDWQGYDAVIAWTVNKIDLLTLYCMTDVYATYAVHCGLLKEKPYRDIHTRFFLYVMMWAEIPAEFTVPDDWTPTPLIPMPEGLKFREAWEWRKQNPLTTITGAVVCITGGTKIQRDALERMIAQHGGEVKNSVTRKTDFVVTSAGYISTKTEMADKQIAAGSSLRIINEDELLALIKAARTFETP